MSPVSSAQSRVPARPRRGCARRLARLTVLVGVGMTAFAATASASPIATTRPALSVVNQCGAHVPLGHVRCFAERVVASGAARSGARKPATTTPAGYGPAQLRAAYALATAAATRGAGQRVYIVDAYDDPKAETDLAQYRAKYGLPVCSTANGCFRKINQTGTRTPLPAADAGWAGEIALDLDMVSAACPRCGITLVEANDSGINMFIAVQKAVSLGAKYVSMSWGMREGAWAPTLDASFFAARGVVYTAAAGDAGYAAGASYPATSPNVIAVGGTSLRTAANRRGWTESVWWQNDSIATGSGCSSAEAKPSWQAVVPASVCGGRAESDISAVADPRTGVAVYNTYGGAGWAVYGGTSAAAPLVAAMYALAGPPSSSAQPAAALYGRTSSFNDVTSGHNGSCRAARLCVAGVGWDGPTGLGSPNGITGFAPVLTAAHR